MTCSIADNETTTNFEATVKKFYHLFSNESNHTANLNHSVDQNPRAVVRDPSEHIWIAHSAWDSPRDDTLQFATVQKRTPGISQASATSHRARRTDHIVVDAAIIGSFEARLAFGVGDNVHWDVLQPVRERRIIHLEITNVNRVSNVLEFLLSSC